MRLKLDENLGREAAEFLASAGHDVSTVFEQGMAGWADEALFRASAAEGRALVTFDLDFSNPFRFEPSSSAGVIVLRPGASHSRRVIRELLDRLASQLAVSDPGGKLWIVEPERVRQYEPGTGTNA